MPHAGHGLPRHGVPSSHYLTHGVGLCVLQVCTTWLQKVVWRDQRTCEVHWNPGAKSKQDRKQKMNAYEWEPLRFHSGACSIAPWTRIAARAVLRVVVSCREQRQVGGVHGCTRRSVAQASR
jgi:hypothetical protein